MKHNRIQTAGRAAALVIAVGALAVGGLQPATALPFGTGTPLSASGVGITAGLDQVWLVDDSGVFSLNLVDASGNTLRQILLPISSADEVRDVAVAADGTVAAVMKVRDTGYPDYDYALVLLDSRGDQTRLAPYATSLAWSPDSSRLAYTVISPDGDGDGRGLAAVRTIGRGQSSSRATTLYSETFTVSRSTGQPSQETGGMSVRAWVGSNLVLAFGCCGDANTALVPTGAPARTLKPVSGWPIGQNSSGSVLVRSEIWNGEGSEADPLTIAGVRYQRLNQDGALTLIRDELDPAAADNADADVRNARAYGYKLYSPPIDQYRHGAPGDIVKAF